MSERSHVMCVKVCVDSLKIFAFLVGFFILGGGGLLCILRGRGGGRCGDVMEGG